MLAFNRIFFGVLSTLVFPLVWLWAYINKKLRVDLEERLLGGDWKGLNLDKSIWIHAASVGELQGVIPLLEKLKAKTSDPIIITTTSSTGKARAIALPSIEKALLIPYDHPLLISLAIRKVKPKLFILFETELWPNLLLQLNKFHVPVVLVNGRISDKTFPNYLRLKIFIEPLLKTLTSCLVQSSKDQVRFEMLGAEDVKVEGSTKFDTELTDIPSQADKLRSELGCAENLELFVCGSVRPGESQTIFEAYKNLRAQFGNLRLLIAPRHPDQFEIEAQSASKFGFKVSKRTDPKPDADVFILNSLGELKLAYTASTISFVGGTLVNVGGHNPLEPASYSKPILLGPHTQNVEEISNELVEAGGAIRVRNSSEIQNEVKKLLLDRNYLVEVGQKAFKVLNNHNGAVSRVLQELMPLIDLPSPKIQNSNYKIILKPFELIYSLIMSIRNYGYDSSLFNTYKSTLPVICVGNLTVGGNAKSPVTQAVVKLLISRGLKPVILLRGYSGSEKGPTEVRNPSEVPKFGDEACMHKLELVGVPVVVSRKRVEGAKFIEKLALGNIIVMDDGFQHRALNRDINLLLFDSFSISQTNSGELLPLGRLREKLASALKRTDAVCLIERGEQLQNPEWIPDEKPVFNLQLEIPELSYFHSERKLNWNELSGKTVSAIASIAKPESFKKMIESHGISVNKTIFKSDHAVWREDELPAIKSLPGDFILTTAKDRIKLKHVPGLPDRLLVAELSVKIPEGFGSWIIQKLR